MMRAGHLLIGGMVLALAACAPDGTQPPSGEAAAPAETNNVAALESKYADNDGVRIHYVAGGSGPLVVMIHGFPDFSGSWSKLMPELSDSYRVAAMDTRGYNLSDQPEAREAYAMPNLVADVAAVIEAEGRESATVIGHDWGAAIAWQFAFSRPDLLDRLVILSVPHPASFAAVLADPNSQQNQNAAYARAFQQEGSEDNLTAEGLAGWVQDPEMKPKYVEAFSRSSFSAMMNYYRMNYPSGDNAPDPNAPPPPVIDAPVLVIHGMQDTALLSAGHNNTWEHISQDTSMLMVPDANHFVQHDAADLVNATIRSWLDIRAGAE